MSQRPPSPYPILVTGAGAGNSSDAANFTLAAGLNAVPLKLGPNLHLQGILFLGAGNFICRPSDQPSGWTPADITVPIPSAMFWDIIPGKINGTGTTALPFVLCYGPLGPGAR